MKNKKKVVYVGLSADILHEGHINILKTANKLGDVIIGLLTDSAISSYKKLPFLNYKQREIVLKNIKFVKKVVPQKTLDYRKNLKLLKPDYVVHGDDWKVGIQKKTRSQVIKVLKQWGGKLIEPKYTKNISSSIVKNRIQKINTQSKFSKSKLKRISDSKKITKIIESYDLQKFPHMTFKKIIELIKKNSNKIINKFIKKKW